MKNLLMATTLISHSLVTPYPFSIQTNRKFQHDKDSVCRPTVNNAAAAFQQRESSSLGIISGQI